MKNIILRFIAIIVFLILSNNVFSQTNKRDTVITTNKQDTILKEKPRRHLDDDGSAEELKKAQEKLKQTFKEGRNKIIISSKAYWQSGGTDLFIKYAKEMKEFNITPEDIK